MLNENLESGVGFSESVKEKVRDFVTSGASRLMHLSFTLVLLVVTAIQQTKLERIELVAMTGSQQLPTFDDGRDQIVEELRIFEAMLARRGKCIPCDAGKLYTQIQQVEQATKSFRMTLLKRGNKPEPDQQMTKLPTVTGPRPVSAALPPKLKEVIRTAEVKSSDQVRSFDHNGEVGALPIRTVPLLEEKAEKLFGEVDSLTEK